MMAASSKFDLSSSSSDGPAHPNGQHWPNVSASLERPGSFRRTSENSGSTSNVSRGGSLSSQVDVGTLLQNLITDLPTTVLESSLSRTGDVRRSISSIIGVSQDDSLTSTVTARPLPSSLEGIRRLKSTLIEDSFKARNRVKVFGEAASKMNKCLSNMSKKRSRTDISSGERVNPAVANGSSSKMGSHSHLNGRSFENGSQKAEERVKGGILNKKIGTFTEERVDVRSSKMTRPSVPAERNKDIFKLTNSNATPLEEKNRVLPAAINGWVKSRTRKKRSSIKSDISGIAVPSRPNDNDRESSKRGLQQKLTVEGRSRMNNTHGFRVNGSEESYSASPTSTMKMNASPRASRLNPGPITKTSSPGTNRTPEISDEWEHQNYKLNRKRTVTACTSSPPQPQWCATRTKKGTRVGRRSNLPPVVSIRDECNTSVTQTTAVNEDNMGNMRRPSSNASIQSKSRTDLISSDGEDYVAVENKSKETSKKCSEIEEKTFKVAAVPPIRRNKIVNEEEQKHRKMSRVAVAPSRSGVSNEMLDVDVDVNAKQISTSGIDYEKFDSRSGRQLTKKSSDRKGHSRPRSDSHSLEFVGESDDDHEELLAVVNAALDSVRHACLPPQPPKTHDQKSFSGKGKTKTQSFWEQNEDFFAFLSVQDQDFLAQQIRLSEDAASYLYDSGDCQNLKGGIECDSVPSNSMLSSSNGTISRRELIMSNQSEHLEPFLKDLVIGNSAQTRLPISHVLLSAIIDYEEIDGYSHKINIEDQSYNNAHGLPTGDVSTFYSYKADNCRNYHDELELDNLGSNGFIDDLVSRPAATSNPACTEFQYSQMCTDERILLELNSIGVYPDIVPCLAPSDDEDVDEGINRLMGKLHEQASKNKKVLLGLEKVVKEAREIQGRELERIALDKLVGLAYEKYMACWGPKASGSKNSNRANKQAAVGFIRRTFARCRKYEETGTGCFGEPPFRDMFYSVSSQKDISRIAADSHPSTSDRNNGLPAQSTRKDYICGSLSDAYQSINQLTEQSNGRDDHWLNKLKKKELLLDEVVGSATDILRASSSFGNGTKGKRSDRDRDGKGQNRESTSKNSNAKCGRTSSSNTKGERKPKSKPKQKMTPINGLLSNSTESPNTIGLDINIDEAGPVSCFPDIANDASAMDFGEFGDFGVQAQDIDSWLNIEDEHLQDDDFMGLEIPMDDLSEVMF